MHLLLSPPGIEPGTFRSHVGHSTTAPPRWNSIVTSWSCVYCLAFFSLLCIFVCVFVFFYNWTAFIFVMLGFNCASKLYNCWLRTPVSARRYRGSMFLIDWLSYFSVKRINSYKYEYKLFSTYSKVRENVVCCKFIKKSFRMARESVRPRELWISHGKMFHIIAPSCTKHRSANFRRILRSS